MKATIFHSLRIAVGLLFLTAGVPKLAGPTDFLKTVYGYEIVGPRLGLLIAVVLPSLEVVVGALLLVHLWTRKAAIIALVLTVGFFIAQAIAVRNGVTADCGCLGLLGPSQLSHASLYRTFALALTCGFVFILSPTSLTPYDKRLHFVSCS